MCILELPKSENAINAFDRTPEVPDALKNIDGIVFFLLYNMFAAISFIIYYYLHVSLLLISNKIYVCWLCSCIADECLNTRNSEFYTPFKFFLITHIILYVLLYIEHFYGFLEQLIYIFSIAKVLTSYYLI